MELVPFHWFLYCHYDCNFDTKAVYPMLRNTLEGWEALLWGRIRVEIIFAFLYGLVEVEVTIIDRLHKNNGNDDDDNDIYTEWWYHVWW